MTTQVANLELVDLLRPYFVAHGASVTAGAFDLDGAPDAGIFDQDGDTTMSAPIDDQIDIEVGGADDFTFTVNTFTALVGSTIKTDSVNETTLDGGVTVDGLLIKDGMVDLNGVADALIFDQDGDTTMSAPTDDQIDVEISGADDFRFLANIFRALSGSQIQTNTINETTADSGVTIDSVLIKDNGITASTGTITTLGSTTINATTVNASLVDVNGAADALVLDTDGDTSLSAPTDDQIDVELNGSDDFTFTVNTFTALLGSVIKTDTINETTTGAGVTIDGVLIKDSGITANPLYANTVNERTAGSGVTVDSVLLKDNGVTAATGTITTLGSTTGNITTVNASLVDINGAADALVLDADGDTSLSAPTDDQIDIELNGADDFTFTVNTFTALSGSVIKADTINETTAAAGVTIDGVLLKDGAVSANGSISVPAGSSIAANIVSETSSGAGVTVDGVLMRDGDVSALDAWVDRVVFGSSIPNADTFLDGATLNQIDIGIGTAIDFRFTVNTFAALAGSVIQTNTINETTAAAGVTIDGVLLKDNNVNATNVNASLVDVNGAANAIVLDADADTHISAPTDDQIDFSAGGGDRMTLTASGLALVTGARITEFSTDGNLAGNSNTVVPTEAAVRTYVLDRVPASATTFTPTVVQGATTFGLTVVVAQYYITGKVCHLEIRLSIASGTGTAGNSIALGGIPAAAYPKVSPEPGFPCGNGLVIDSGVSGYTATVVATSTSQLKFLYHGGYSYVGIGPSFAMTTGDTIFASCTYEVN